MQMYRKELKFILPESSLCLIESRLKNALKRDEHQVGDYYLIRSIYFDSPDDYCYRENRAGVGAFPRKKYRIRIYGNMNPSTSLIEMSDKKISAEIKTRFRDAISKESADISRETLEAIIMGDYSSMYDLVFKEKYLEPVSSEKDSITDNNQRFLVYTMYWNKLAGEKYSPKTIVEYKRSAYTYTPSNVRITFDRDITASKDYERFFEDNLRGFPIMERGWNVLEVKYDEFLPDEVRMLLAGVDLERTSCSKYCLCREAVRDYFVRSI